MTTCTAASLLASPGRQATDRERGGLVEPAHTVLPRGARAP